MGTLADGRENEEQRAEESIDGATATPVLQKQIADPVVYKLVRVEGDGSLVPATDDEVMEVEDMFEDGNGIAKLKNTKVDSEKLNARLEYIGVMLQKVKQEERLRLLGGSPDHTSDYMHVDGQRSDIPNQFSACDKKPQTEISFQEAARMLSPRLSESCTNQLEIGETCLNPKDGSVVSESSTSASCSNSMPDFSKIKGEICLDNLSIRELHDTFKATFGRETTVKDKLWLKRRIAMGLTNSCDVSTTTFTIKDNKLVRTKSPEVYGAMERCKSVDQISGAATRNHKDSPASPSDIMKSLQDVSGKRLRKPELEFDCTGEDINTEQTALKRARKPTKRYIEELSEAETRECSGKLVTSTKTSSDSQSCPNSLGKPIDDVGADGPGFTKRQLSIGGSGVHVPYVSRIRRGRPRENYMPLMKYHPNGGIKLEDKLVKQALGVHNPRQDDQIAGRPRLVPENIQQQIVAETEEENPNVITCSIEQHQVEEPQNLDSFEDNLDYDSASLPTVNSGTRRKHHRAWSLSEVIKLVEGVSKYGAGRWSEIKRVAFGSNAYRTSVDLKDKWRNLLRATFAQAPSDKGMKNSRKHASMPIPAHILLRVRELAQRHAQADAPDMSVVKFSGYGGKSVFDTRSGYL